MSRTKRNFPFKLPLFTHESKENLLQRDGVSSKLSPSKAYKKQYNQKFRTRQKRHLKQGKPYDLNKKSHVWQWW